MIQTKCQWCKREIVVKNWEPVTNDFLKVNPVICHLCRVEYEAGLFQMKVKNYIKTKRVNEVIK